MTSPNIFSHLLVLLFGLCFGSFSNVIILRLPKGKSIVRPRSQCPKCKVAIRAADNIPVISFLLLRGKCRKCKAPISIRYPIVEIICAVLFLACYLRFGSTVSFFEYTLFFWAGLTASVIDLDHRILPDVMTLPGIVIGLVGASLNPERSFVEAFAGVVMGGGLLWLAAFFYFHVKKVEGMGGGDIKLLAWIGALVGWRPIFFLVFLSSVSGALIGLGYGAAKKTGMKTAIPFGPFLFAAAVVHIFIHGTVIQGRLAFLYPFGF